MMHFFTSQVGSTAARSIRLDTLVNLRWLAIAGQLLAVFIVYFGLGYDLPVPTVMGVITVAVALNLILRVRYPLNHRIDDGPAAALLAFDIIQLAALLFLTGGLENPFAILFLAPVMISATVLPPIRTLSLGALAVIGTTLLAFSHLPLPWAREQAIGFPPLYLLGIWSAISLALCFIGVFAWRVSDESRLMGDALAATELALAREQHLSQLDGLAAAAAHELGTPLATIALVAKEMQREVGNDGHLAEDIRLLREQVERCRQILGKITTLGTEPAGPMSTVTLKQLIEEVSAPQRPFEVKILVSASGEGPEPTSPRSPGLIHGLENLIDNAVDFAVASITIEAKWTPARVSISIRDDGPGFAHDVLRRLGEPYVTTRRFNDRNRDGGTGGLGLGLFIAKTLLERSGATFTARNRGGSRRGAEVILSWPREAFEAGTNLT